MYLQHISCISKMHHTFFYMYTNFKIDEILSYPIGILKSILKYFQETIKNIPDIFCYPRYFLISQIFVDTSPFSPQDTRRCHQQSIAIYEFGVINPTTAPCVQPQSPTHPQRQALFLPFDYAAIYMQSIQIRIESEIQKNKIIVSVGEAEEEGFRAGFDVSLENTFNADSSRARFSSPPPLVPSPPARLPHPLIRLPVNANTRINSSYL